MYTMADPNTQCVILNAAKRSEGSGLRIDETSHSWARCFTSFSMTKMIRVLSREERKMKRLGVLLIIVSIASAVHGKVDLVTLPARDTVQLTIYNSADMTLARESRALTLKEGENKLQFSWANPLIDRTSLEMLPKGNADKIDILD